MERKIKQVVMILVLPFLLCACSANDKEEEQMSGTEEERGTGACSGWGTGILGGCGAAD